MKLWPSSWRAKGIKMENNNNNNKTSNDKLILSNICGRISKEGIKSTICGLT